MLWALVVAVARGGVELGSGSVVVALGEGLALDEGVALGSARSTDVVVVDVPAAGVAVGSPL